jgi:pilus assembly protein CpaE
MSGIREIIEQPAATPPAVHSPAFAIPAAPRPAAPPREKFIGFVNDQASATLLHQALAPAFPQGCQLHIVDFRTSLKLLAAMRTPQIILVDVTDEEQPINAIMDLAEVVEEGTVVLAIGQTHNVNFYRTVTRGMGVREYLAKPLTVAGVQRHFLELTKAEIEEAAAPQRGGRMVAVGGVRGGVGVTTIAANLAWMIGTEMHRHTVLLDSDLHTGTAALALNVPHHQGLRTALETPDRLDELLIERSTQAAGERLHVLAGLEALNTNIPYARRAAATLTQALRARYNFVVADAGCRLSPFSRDLLHLAHQRVLVVDPSMIGIRNLERLLAIPGGPLQSPRAVLALNMANAPGGLSQAYIEQTLGLKFDAVIPELPRLAKAAQFGQAAAEVRGPFRTAIQTIAARLGARAFTDPTDGPRHIAA